jgi:hypothetical protein
MGQEVHTMPKRRIDVPGALHLVMGRGIARKEIFLEKFLDSFRMIWSNIFPVCLKSGNKFGQEVWP